VGAFGAVGPELGFPEVGVPEVGVPEVGVPEVGVPEVGDDEGGFELLLGGFEEGGATGAVQVLVTVQTLV